MKRIYNKTSVVLVLPQEKMAFSIKCPTNKTFTVTEVGYFTPGNYMPTEELLAGDVGYIAASIKSLSDLHVGDTITKLSNEASKMFIIVKRWKDCFWKLGLFYSYI